MGLVMGVVQSPFSLPLHPPRTARPGAAAALAGVRWWAREPGPWPRTDERSSRLVASLSVVAEECVVGRLEILEGHLGVAADDAQGVQ